MEKRGAAHSESTTDATLHKKGEAAVTNKVQVQRRTNAESNTVTRDKSIPEEYTASTTQLPWIDGTRSLNIQQPQPPSPVVPGRAEQASQSKDPVHSVIQGDAYLLRGQHFAQTTQTSQAKPASSFEQQRLSPEMASPTTPKDPAEAIRRRSLAASYRAVRELVRSNESR